MNDFFLIASLFMAVIIAGPMIRVLKGPTVYDRLIGANAITTKTIVLVCLVGFQFERMEMFLDITLAYAILGFIGSLAIAKYLTSPKGRQE